MDSVFSYFVEDYGQVLTDALGISGGFFAGGAIAAFIAWSIGYAVHSVFRWLNDTTRER